MQLNKKYHKTQQLTSVIKQPLLIFCYGGSMNSFEYLELTQTVIKLKLAPINISIPLVNSIFKKSILNNCKTVLQGPVLILTVNNTRLSPKLNLKFLNSQISLFSLKINNKLYALNLIQDCHHFLYFKTLNNFVKILKIYTNQHCVFV